MYFFFLHTLRKPTGVCPCAFCCSEGPVLLEWRGDEHRGGAEKSQLGRLFSQLHCCARGAPIEVCRARAKQQRWMAS